MTQQNNNEIAPIEGEHRTPTRPSDQTTALVTQRHREERRRPVVVVLGMARSGTSLLAQILHRLGVDMVDAPPNASPANPTGFWERPEIVALQDEILDLVDHPIASAAHVLPMSPGWWRDPKLFHVKRRLRDFVATSLSATDGLWGFKDPRTARLLPVWQEIFNDLGLNPRFVWAMRAPSESGTSMSLKSPELRPMSAEYGTLMWFAYNMDVVGYAGNSIAAVVTYEDWFDNPEEAAIALNGKLGLVWPGADAPQSACLRQIVQPQHRHHDHRLQSLPLAEFETLVEGSRALGQSDTRATVLSQILPRLEFGFRLLSLMNAPLRELDEARVKLRAMREKLKNERNATHRTREELERLRRELKGANDAVGRWQDENAVNVAMINEAHASLKDLTDTNKQLVKKLDEAHATVKHLEKASKDAAREVELQKRLKVVAGERAKRIRKGRGPQRRAELKQIERDMAVVKKSTAFNSEWYLSMNQDVARSKVDPARHFVVFGWLELRDPGPNFNTREYLLENPAAITPDFNPVVHYEAQRVTR